MLGALRKSRCAATSAAVLRECCSCSSEWSPATLPPGVEDAELRILCSSCRCSCSSGSPACHKTGFQVESSTGLKTGSSLIRISTITLRLKVYRPFIAQDLMLSFLLLSPAQIGSWIILVRVYPTN